MGQPSSPRKGSLQFWPRKRSRHSLVRIRTWAPESKVKPLGFIAFKAGMTHLMLNDNRPKSPTKGETISLPATILDCPPMTIVGVAFYQKSQTGVIKSASILAKNLSKEYSLLANLPKKSHKSLDEIKNFDDLRLLVQANPKMASTGTKKPKLLEIALGGSKEDKLKFAHEFLGKEIKVNDVFDAGNFVDVHGVTKGKGFQGTVKRFGVPIRQHKAEKTKRGIGTLGPWHPNRVRYSVAQAGKMGYHQRTEYNKQVLKIGTEGNDVNPKGGIDGYGLVKNHYLLLKGSVVGSKKRAVVLIPAIRPDPKIHKGTMEVTYINK